MATHPSSPRVNRLAAAGLRNPTATNARTSLWSPQRPSTRRAERTHPGRAAAADHCAPGRPIVFSHGAAGAHGGFVLARSVLPSTELLGVHATVLRLADDHLDGETDHCRPGQWAPHVTLARRLSARATGNGARAGLRRRGPFRRRRRDPTVGRRGEDRVRPTWKVVLIHG